MKIDRLFVAFAFLATLLVTPSFAQTRPAGPQSTPPATANVAIPDAKVALIFSEAFQDPKTGIAKFNVVVNNLNREFTPRQTELNQLGQKAQQLNDDIEKTRSVADPKTIAQKVDQLEQMKKELQRKSEDATAAFEKRKGDVFRPLQEEIGKALEAYAKAHNITVIIDGSQVPVVYASDSVDITRAFINDFNSKYPATAAATPTP
jgi:Skp family chaperone for outer membrane proteins